MRAAAPLIAPLLTLGACTSTPDIGDQAPRRGDEIVVAGVRFHTGAPVVLWTDPGGYDAYRVERRFVPWEQAGWEATSKAGIEERARYNLRFQRRKDEVYSPEQFEQVRGGGWTLDLLRDKVDQFVIHYDVCGTSRTCFRVLHDMRGLSIHFMLDVDGTIYQTLDVKERAWHATTSNDRSVGIEIAHIGAYPPDKAEILDKWYAHGPDGLPVITLPPHVGDGGVRTPGPYRPAVPPGSDRGRVTGPIHGTPFVMYDLTNAQYDSLTKLTAALHVALPRIRLDYPRDTEGRLLTTKLPDDQLAEFTGLLGHYHIQADKIDPGPAFDWDRVVRGARGLVGRRRPESIGHRDPIQIE